MNERIVELMTALVSEMKWISLCMGVAMVTLLIAFFLYFTSGRK